MLVLFVNERPKSILGGHWDGSRLHSFDSCISIKIVDSILFARAIQPTVRLHGKVFVAIYLFVHIRNRMRTTCISFLQVGAALGFMPW